jgi:hypothetical protein
MPNKEMNNSEWQRKVNCMYGTPQEEAKYFIPFSRVQT